MTLLLTDERMLRHETGRHVEIPARLAAVTAKLAETGLSARCTRLEFGPVGDDEIARVHDAAVARMVDGIAAAGGGMADADTVVSPESPLAGRLAAGACCAAVDAVLAGKDATAFCAVRPPGHHATPGESMGFCLFNSVALAARRAVDRHGLSRVLVIDWDVHHGNGTQDVFYSDPNVAFLSVHRYGDGFYPGTGAADETGAGRGQGLNRNVTIRFGASRPAYFDAVAKALHALADRHKPELVLVSAGFDAHRLDPIGSLGLETEDFEKLTRLVQEVATAHAKGRLVSCLEGGYHLAALADAAATHVATLLGPKT